MIERSPPSPLPARIAGTVVAFALLCGLPTLVYPFGRDQGNYAAAGWMWREGGVLYRDILSFKPPASAWVHGLSQMLFGTSPLAIRLWDLGWTAATAAALAALAWRLTRRTEVALVSGLAYALLYWHIDYWNVAQTDGWLNLPATLAVLLVLRGCDAWTADQRSRAVGQWLAAGAASALAVLFKYTAGFIALPMLVAFGLAARAQGARVWWGVAWVALGGLAPLALTAGGLVLRGAWPAYARTQFQLVGGYVGETRVAADLPSHVRHFFALSRSKSDVVPVVASGFVAGLPAALYLRRRGDWLTGLLVGLWWALAAATVAAQGKFFDYHYLPLLPPSCLGVGLAGAWLADHAPAPLRSLRPGRVVVAAALAVVAVGVQPGRFRDLVSIGAGSTTMAQYYRSKPMYRYRDWNVDEQRRLVEHLRATTDPDARVFIWGFDPGVYVWARRQPASGVLYTYPLAVPWSDHELWLDLLLDDLQASSPAVFVVSSHDATPRVTRNRKDSRALLEDLPRLKRFLLGHYTREATLGRYDVWRRSVTRPGEDATVRPAR